MGWRQTSTSRGYDVIIPRPEEGKTLCKCAVWPSNMHDIGAKEHCVHVEVVQSSWKAWKIILAQLVFHAHVLLLNLGGNLSWAHGTVNGRSWQNELGNPRSSLHILSWWPALFDCRLDHCVPVHGVHSEPGQSTIFSYSTRQIKIWTIQKLYSRSTVLRYM